MSFFTKMCVKGGGTRAAPSGQTPFDPNTYVRPTPKGKCRAVFIGINYPGQQGELRGCVNDVKMMMQVLQHNGFPLTDIRVLIDTNDIPQKTGEPTKKNIEDALKWLVQGAAPGDTLFLHYSGHGTQVKDIDGDEDDGKDEALCPCDYQSAGMIVDDDIVRMLVVPLPAGVRLTALLDCCHSGTLMDLPFTFSASAPVSSLPPSMSMGSQWTNPAFILGLVSGGNPIGNIKNLLTQTASPAKGTPALPGDVIMFSGCMDTQTSADVSSTSAFNIPAEAGPGGAGGACTSALTEVLMSNPNIPFVDLLEKMRINLKARRFTQVPQLSSSKPVDLGRPFSLFGDISTATARVVPPDQKNQHKLAMFTGNPMFKSLTDQLPGGLGGMVSSFL